jgi:hypothetical protein
MAIRLETQKTPRDVVREPDKAKSVWLRRCATGAAECMEELVLAHELRRVWPDLDAHVGNMACILWKQRPSRIRSANFCVTARLCSERCNGHFQ